MAGNTRGKVKEHAEGIHRNFDWIQYHCEKLLGLIGDKKPNLSEAVGLLAKSVTELDKLVQSLYSKL
ncbi:unnamed protein product [marine sediment metagenome]|uniref:Uncharacterized protein n=1 Tax=marine sediment metagenome TaxID=412755 RepID=X1R9H9_9ZZZZ